MGVQPPQGSQSAGQVLLAVAAAVSTQPHGDRPRDLLLATNGERLLGIPVMPFCWHLGAGNATRSLQVLTPSQGAQRGPDPMSSSTRALSCLAPAQHYSRVGVHLGATVTNVASGGLGPGQGEAPCLCPYSGAGAVCLCLGALCLFFGGRSQVSVFRLMPGRAQATLCSAVHQRTVPGQWDCPCAVRPGAAAVTTADPWQHREDPAPGSQQHSSS